MTKLLYQEVMKNLSAPLNQMGLTSHMQQAVVFDVQNVAEYFYLSPQDWWEIEKDFPNLAPPYPDVWMECSAPDVLAVKGQMLKAPPGAGGARYGFMIWSTDSQEPEARWQSIVHFFVSAPGYQPMLACAWALQITQDGRLARRISTGNQMFGMINFTLPEEKLEEARQHSVTILAPALLALSFLHCKNVTLEAQGGEKRTSYGQRKRHQPAVKHYTLNIHPMRRVLESEGGSDSTGLKNALHICRGHFKDFSKGKGLFGKYRGMYWWDNMVRGNKAAGEVEKDYAVHEPQ